MIAIQQGKSGAIFGNDDHPAFATQGLRGASHISGRTSHVGWLRDDDFDWEEYTCEHNASGAENRFHDNFSRLYP